MSVPLDKLLWVSFGQTFSTNLRDVRLARGITQKELSEISGISRSQISNLERNDDALRNQCDPQLSTVYRLAFALEVPPALLLPGVSTEGFAGHMSGEEAAEVPQDLCPFPQEYLFQKCREARPWGI